MITLYSFIRTLNRAADLKQPNTKDHSRRVSNQSVLLGSRLGLGPRTLKYISYGADIHDIGKVYIPSSILFKPAKLNSSEYAAVKEHPRLGLEMLEFVTLPKTITDCVYMHHEHWDGSGYPQHLEGNAIPYYVGIVTISDVWDALLSNRSYRGALSKKVALAEMDRIHHWFIPDVYKEWLKMVRSP